MVGSCMRGTVVWIGVWGNEEGCGMVQGGFRGVGRARREEGGFKVQVRMGGCDFSVDRGGWGT